MTRTVKVSMARKAPTPWAVSTLGTSGARTFDARVLGRQPLPDGRELALVTFGVHPHWLPGFTVEVFGLAEGTGESWALAGLAGESGSFGVTDARSWLRRRVDRAWASA